MASVLNALSSLHDVLGVSVVNAIEHGLDSRCFMLGGVDRQLDKLPSRAADYMKGQLARHDRFFGRQSCHRLPPKRVLSTTRQGLASPFRRPSPSSRARGSRGSAWGRYEGFSKEHWARVKALNRRIAGELDDEYRHAAARR